MPNNRIRINPTGWVIGVFYALMAIGLVGVAHEHDHTILGSTDCSACFFNVSHVGVELDVVEITNLDTCLLIPPPFGFTFISPILDNSIQSRAPPVFSV